MGLSMLEKVDLSKKIDDEEYKDLVDKLEIKMGELQRKSWKMQLPIIVVFEGWHASGMSDIINRFILPMDPRGFRFHTATSPTDEEKLRPLLWRFWTKVPARGQVAIFDRSWYRRAIIEHIEKNNGKGLERCLQGIRSFERQLADDGYLIIKFFLHISKEKQQQRFKELEKNNGDLFIVGEDEVDYANEYETYLYTVEKILENTDSFRAPWTIVEANNRNFATVKIMTAFINAMEDKLKEVDYKSVTETTVDLFPKDDLPGITSLKTSILARTDMDKTIDKKDYKKKKKDYQERLRHLQYELLKRQIPVIIIYEGWDASGKGGNIRRLAHRLNPRLYSVIPIGAPNDYEISRHYLWRFLKEIPPAGRIAIFDRSWYGRVMVERVEQLCTENEWKRAYREINEFEAMLTDWNAVVVKFWLQIDQETQFERFQKRSETPHKQWKITQEDWRNRDNWDAYREAVDEMLEKTSTTYAPWTIVEGNDKKYARIKAMKTVTEAIEEKLKN